jgi:peptidoglycan hydrolase-like protein with peptidoglycan-binding domain
MKNLFLITEEEKRRILGLHESANKRQYLNEQITIPKYNKTEVLKGSWASYPCVVNHPNAKPVYVQRGEFNWDFKIGDFTYLSNGKKIGKDNVQTTYTCKDAEFKISRVVPTTTDQLAKGQGFLKLNDKNDLVKRVQNQLITAGESVTPTGIFDKATYDAVKLFQGKQNPPLKADGIVGKGTWLALSKVKPEMMAAKEVTLTNPQQSTTNTATQQPAQPLSSAKQPDNYESF